MAGVQYNMGKFMDDNIRLQGALTNILSVQDMAMALYRSTKPEI